MKIILCKHDSSGSVTLEISETEFEALKHFLKKGIDCAAHDDWYLQISEKMMAQMNRITFN